MPVRFRCQYCNQLLGIAHRKIGTAVECPTCHHHVIVPPKDALDLQVPAAGNDPPLFERSDFDAVLNPARRDQPMAETVPRADPPPPPGNRGPAPAWSQPGQAAYDVEPYRPSPPPPYAPPPGGLVLTPLQATLLTVAAVLILALAFGGGLLVGRFLL